MDPNFQQALEEPNNERTILDYLNDDCWRAVLNYVPVRDMICTERTSREWQRTMLLYLSTVRISIGKWWNKNKNDHNFVVITKDADFSSFELWSKKLGHTVVAFEKYCGDTEECMVLRNNCSNLEVLKLTNVSMLQEQRSPNTEEYFPELQRICFESCDSATDDCLSSFITSRNLEELEILINNLMTGRCLNSIKSTKLKSLVFRNCKYLGFEPLMSIADRLGGLTKFVLARSRRRMHDQIYLLLNKMPKLEYLTIQITDGAHLDEQELDSIAFYEVVSRLAHLKHLSSNFVVWEGYLEQVTQGCKELETLKLVCNGVTGDSLQAVYRNIGERLKCLYLFQSHLTADDYEECIYACPNLTRLSVSGDLKLVITRVGEARRQICPDKRLQLVCEDCGSEDWDTNEFADVLDFKVANNYDSDGVEDSY
ncbi:uncharacterized protein LOC133529954 isoform X1 [Cydia pomonella]|uniref:uncharacterized protein LOC133529954 isoform X1 n=1 Tax=Cydia pomonella TaxID=82600 RepID=UPI002ADDB3DB|nr:uncharacterized protein LOC133529954 isoform X1 [Cydia pomonella]